MELLRRAVLVGCILPGLWLLRLAPLDPLLTVVPVDFAERQRREAAAVPDEQKTEAQRRNAEIPLPVYVEEVLQYNVFSASGPAWDRLLAGVDRFASGEGADGELSRRASADRAQPDQGGGSRYLFFRPDEEPIHAVLDKLAFGGGTTYVSMSRPGRDLHYRVERRAWTREHFRPGAGFTGRPSPPARFFYPFRALGVGCVLAGLLLFALIPSPGRSRSRPGPAPFEAAALAAGLLLFAAPLVAVGGSVQALTRGIWITVPCWALAAAGFHLFARPGRNVAGVSVEAAPNAPGAASTDRSQFLRQGLAFLGMAFGPVAFLIAASVTLWNR